ncbi:MAG: hypothetical protein ACTSVI_05585 [Promethearchaeota archaeon]
MAFIISKVFSKFKKWLNILLSSSSPVFLAITTRNDLDVGVLVSRMMHYLLTSEIIE